MGGGIARVDCVCMCRVAQTRVRRLVADCGNFVLRCFVGWDDDCGGGFDGKEVIMWYLYVIFAIVLFCFGGLFALAILDIFQKDKQEEFDNPFLQLSHISINLLEDYHELEKQNNELKERLKKYENDSNKGGVVPPNKKREDFITRSETVVDIDKLKEIFEKEQQKQ